MGERIPSCAVFRNIVGAVVVCYCRCCCCVTPAFAVVTVVASVAVQEMRERGERRERRERAAEEALLQRNYLLQDILLDNNQSGVLDGDYKQQQYAYRKYQA